MHDAFPADHHSSGFKIVGPPCLSYWTLSICTTPLLPCIIRGNTDVAVWHFNMPKSRQRSWHGRAEDLTVTSSFPIESTAESNSPSPTSRRAGLYRTQSNQSDERTTLLQNAGRSRIRLQSAAEIASKLKPSRHSSNTGIFSLEAVGKPALLAPLRIG